MSRGCGMEEDELEELGFAPNFEESIGISTSAQFVDQTGECGNACRSNGGGCSTKRGCSNKELNNGNRSLNSSNLDMQQRDYGSGKSQIPCSRCKDRPSNVSVRQGEPLCGDCLMESVRGKVRHAIKVKNVIQPGDRVLVAADGKLPSQALIHLLVCHRNPGSRPERGKVKFDMTVLHINDKLWDVGNLSSNEGLNNGTNEPNVSVERLVGGLIEVNRAEGVEFVSIPLEDVFGGLDGHGRLRQCVFDVSDATGREDFVKHLKYRLAVRFAKENGFNKLAMSDSATALAALIISSACKAQGHGLPGDIHFSDNRFGPQGPCVVKPLREVIGKELALYCYFQNIPYFTPTSNDQRSSMNLLAESFVHGIQNAFPSGLSAILRTGTKLQAFDFNEVNVGNDASNREDGFKDGRLCGICFSPLDAGKFYGSDMHEVMEKVDEWWQGRFCFSCWNQIILKFRAPRAGGMVDFSELGDLKECLEALAL